MEDRDYLQQKLQFWQKYIESYRLPQWEELPDFGLYMDQVVLLLEQYLSFVPAGAGERVVTAAAVNNYVRLKLMPAPVKKKYRREHLAYLVMLLILKQVLTMGDIQRLLPQPLLEGPEETEFLYRDFCRQFTRTVPFFGQQLQQTAESLCREGERPDTVRPLVMENVLLAGYFQILAQKLLRLTDEPKQWDA